MTLRRVPGAVALGLVASLAAHAALFGDGHAMGGIYHAVIVQAGAAGCVSLVTFFAALAWSELNGAADGSILAYRLRESLPGIGTLVCSTTLWYAACEAIEPHHAAAPPLVVPLVLIAVAWLVLRLARGIVAALARVAVGVQRTIFSPRSPSWQRRRLIRPIIAARTFWAFRRFARPPPIAIPCA